MEFPVDFDTHLKNLETTFQTVNTSALLRILEQLLPILNQSPLTVSYLLRFRTLDIWLCLLSSPTASWQIKQLCLECLECVASNSSDVAQLLIDRSIFDLLDLLFTNCHAPLIVQTLPRVCISILPYSSEFCELYLKSPLFHKFYEILNITHNPIAPPSDIAAYSNGESSVIQLTGILIQYTPALPPDVIRGIIEWILAVIKRQHYHCLPAIACACSAIVGKCAEARDLLLTTGFMGILQSHLTMDNSKFWGKILKILEICTAAFVGALPEQAAFVVKAIRPSQIALVTAVDLFARGSAAGNGLKLMSHLIDLRGETVMREMNLRHIFRALSEKAECLDCQEKLGGLSLALNAIWWGFEELIVELFDSRLMMVLGEALEVADLNRGVAIATMERLWQLRALRESEREFMELVFVPFLKACGESEDRALVIQAESFLKHLEDATRVENS